MKLLLSILFQDQTIHAILWNRTYMQCVFRVCFVCVLLECF